MALCGFLVHALVFGVELLDLYLLSLFFNERKLVLGLLDVKVKVKVKDKLKAKMF